MVCPQVPGGGDRLQIWRVSANVLNKQLRTAKKEWSSNWGVGCGANNSPYLLMTVVKEISKYKLDLVRAQEVRWGRDSTKSAGEYTSFCGKGNENHKLGTSFLVHRRVVSAFKKVEFISDRISYIILREC
jgi:hypothetical protein